MRVRFKVSYKLIFKKPSKSFLKVSLLREYFFFKASYLSKLIHSHFFPARERIWQKGLENADKKLAQLQDPGARSSCKPKTRDGASPGKQTLENDFL